MIPVCEIALGFDLWMNEVMPIVADEYREVARRDDPGVVPEDLRVRPASVQIHAFAFADNGRWGCEDLTDAIRL